jgi:thiamine biosynthesis lipoprotein
MKATKSRQRLGLRQSSGAFVRRMEHRVTEPSVFPSKQPRPKRQRTAAVQDLADFMTGRAKAGVATGGALIATFLFSASSRAAPPIRRPCSVFEFQRPEMGLPFRLVLYAPAGITATNAAEAAFGRITELNSVLQRLRGGFRTEPALPAAAAAVRRYRSVRTCGMYWRSRRRFHVRSDGAFDLTVGPVVQTLGSVPGDSGNCRRRARSRRARAAVGWQFVELDRQRHTALLRVPHVVLDPGGHCQGLRAG